jgi:hypothetical protein
MIADGTESYMWKDGSSTGVKMAISTSASSEKSSLAGPDMDQQATVNCSDWTEDDSLFAAPTSVNFMDATEMMKGAMMQGGAQAHANASASGDMKAAQCAACGYLPASQQAQCKKQLGC